MKLLDKIYNPQVIRSKSGREYYFDNLKFILIFLVVLGHFVELSMYNSNNAKIIWTFLYSFHMPLFVFISGYFAKNAVKNKNINRGIIFLLIYLLMKIVMHIVDKCCGLNPNLNLSTVNSVQWYVFALGAWYLISILLKNINQKYLFVFSIILALIIGFDKNIGDTFCISRILVFYPFFLLGLNTNKEPLMNIVKNKRIRIVSIFYLVILILLFILFADELNLLKPIFLGKSAYNSLKNSIEPWGVCVRAGWYIIATITGISVMSIIPKGKTIVTKLGQRTISVYFYHAIIFRVCSKLEISFRVYQEILLAIIVVLIFSTKLFATPLEKILKINLFDKKEERMKIDIKNVVNIVFTFMIILIMGGVLLCGIIRESINI